MSRHHTPKATPRRGRKSLSVRTTRGRVSLPQAKPAAPRIQGSAPPPDLLGSITGLSRALLDALPLHVAVLDSRGVIIQVNRAWLDFANLNGPAEVHKLAAGVSYLGVCRKAGADEHALKALRGIESVLSGEQDRFVLEYPCHSPSEARWFLMTVTRPTPEVGGAIVVHTDISVQWRAQQALRSSIDHYQLILEGSHAGIWDWDIAAHSVRFSPRWKEMRGFALHEVSDSEQEWSSGIHPDDAPRVMAALQRHFEGKSPFFSEEYRVRRRDGTWMWIADRGVCRRDATGRAVRMAGSETDISERKWAEEALKRSEAGLKQAIRVAGLGTFEHDHRTDQLTFSPIMKELVGFAPAESVSLLAFLERVLPEDREQLRVMIDQAHNPAGDGMFQAVYRVRAADGSIRWLSVRSETFFEGPPENRWPARTIGAVLDITVQKEYQQALEKVVTERTGRLQELVADLEHFSYTITHDMRGPLRGMKGFAELLTAACQDQPGDPRSEFAHRIMVSAERLDALITDALSYTKAVRQELPSEQVDIGPLLRGMLDTYPELQPSHASVEILGDLPIVIGNAAGLTQCFSNLLANAVKFARPGETPRIRIWHEARGEWARIWIEDQGIGIPRTLLPRVFDMFTRGSNDFPGTGIGLALVRKVAQRMGGRIGVESEEGKSTRFWLELRKV